MDIGNIGSAGNSIKVSANNSAKSSKSAAQVVSVQPSNKVAQSDKIRQSAQQQVVNESTPKGPAPRNQIQDGLGRALSKKLANAAPKEASAKAVSNQPAEPAKQSVNLKSESTNAKESAAPAKSADGGTQNDRVKL